MSGTWSSPSLNAGTSISLSMPKVWRTEMVMSGASRGNREPVVSMEAIVVIE